jgi:hypothetical protein
MMFESEYRRQAFKKWENEKEEIVTELKESIEQKKSLSSNRLVHAFAIILAWFSQH